MRGGHAKVICDIIEKQGKFKIQAFVEYNAKESIFCDYPVLDENSYLEAPSCKRGIIAVGDNFKRFKIRNKIINKIPDFEFVSAIHPSAQISKGVIIGKGVCVMANATINADSNIGDHVIVNTNASVDHDCNLGQFSSIAPNAALGGNCSIGEYSAVSIGATIIHNIGVGTNTIIGAGATVVGNIGANGLYLGVPAKLHSNREFGQKYL